MSSRHTGTGQVGVLKITGYYCNLCCPSFGWPDGCDDCKICYLVYKRDSDPLTLQQKELEALQQIDELIQQGYTEEELHKRLHKDRKSFWKNKLK